MRLADKASEWHDTQTEQKQNEKYTKDCENLNCKFNNHSLTDFTD